MNKRAGYFKRLGQPTVIRIGNRPQIVKTGDTILADFDFMMTQTGWKYEPKFDPKKASKIAQTQVRPERPSVPIIGAVQINSKSIQAPAPVVTPTDPVVVDVKTLAESQQREIVINIDKLKPLKNLDNKDWVKFTAEDIIAILNEAHIDFTAVGRKKWDLLRFLKGIVQDL